MRYLFLAETTSNYVQVLAEIVSFPMSSASYLYLELVLVIFTYNTTVAILTDVQIFFRLEKTTIWWLKPPKIYEWPFKAAQKFPFPNRKRARVLLIFTYNRCPAAILVLPNFSSLRRQSKYGKQ